jgi:hypothetical protein
VTDGYSDVIHFNGGLCRNDVSDARKSSVSPLLE